MPQQQTSEALRKWFAIKPHEHPVTLYRLLGLQDFEEDADVIDAAADQRMLFLRQKTGGNQSMVAQKLLNQVSKARTILNNPKNRAAYDNKLRGHTKPGEVGVASKPPPAPSSKPGEVGVASVAPPPPPTSSAARAPEAKLVDDDVADSSSAYTGKCPSCGNFISKGQAGFCQSCGWKQPPKTTLQAKKVASDSGSTVALLHKSRDKFDLLLVQLKKVNRGMLIGGGVLLVSVILTTMALFGSGDEEGKSNGVRKPSPRVAAVSDKKSPPPVETTSQAEKPPLPPLVKMEFLVKQLFSGHSGPVTSAALSSDGKRAFTCSRDGARLWDVEIGKELRKITENETIFLAAAYSPDAKTVLMGSSKNEAPFWEVGRGRIGRRLRWHRDSVVAVAFAPDGKHIMTGSLDGTAKLWEAGNGKLIHTFTKHGLAVVSVAFSQDGKQVLTVSLDGTTRSWDVKNKSTLLMFRGHKQAVRSAVFSPDGTYVLTGSDDGTARIWDAKTGQMLRVIEGGHGAVRSVAFLPEGRFLLTGSADGTICLWETATGRAVYSFERLHSAAINSLNLSADGKWLLSGSTDKTARLWEAFGGPKPEEPASAKEPTDKKEPADAKK